MAMPKLLFTLILSVILENCCSFKISKVAESTEGAIEAEPGDARLVPPELIPWASWAMKFLREWTVTGINTLLESLKEDR